jgi:hypothetical protein
MRGSLELMVGWERRGKRVGIEPEPGAGEGSAEFDEAEEVPRFNDEAGGAEAIGLVYVADVGGGSEDDDAQAVEMGPFLDVAQDVEPIEAGHAKVQQEESRERESGSIGERFTGFEVGDGSRAGGDGFDGVWNAGLLEGTFDKKDIVGIIFGEEDEGFGVHGRDARNAVKVWAAAVRGQRAGWNLAWGGYEAGGEAAWAQGKGWGLSRAKSSNRPGPG